MALCLPRRRRAASLATRPSTLSVASITNHSCFTSAGFALTVVVIKTLEFGLAGSFPRSVFFWREPLRRDWNASSRSHKIAAKPGIIRKIKDLANDPPAGEPDVGKRPKPDARLA